MEQANSAANGQGQLDVKLMRGSCKMPCKQINCSKMSGFYRTCEGLCLLLNNTNNKQWANLADEQKANKKPMKELQKWQNLNK